MHMVDLGCGRHRISTMQGQYYMIVPVLYSRDATRSLVAVNAAMMSGV